jgi:hypothetical protein
MKKTKYNLFLVRGTIDAIKQLAKSYDIELIETNFWGDIYYEFETDTNESTPHPFISEVSKNEYVVVTKSKDDNQTKNQKFKFAEETSRSLLYPPQSELGAYAKEFIYDVINTVGKKIVATELQETPLDAISYNDVSSIMKHLPLLKISDNHVFILKFIVEGVGGHTYFFPIRKEGLAEYYPKKKVPEETTMLIGKGINIERKFYETPDYIPDKPSSIFQLFDLMWFDGTEEEAFFLKNQHVDIWKYIHVPFSKEGIWQAFLLYEMWRMLPLHWHANYAEATYILDMDDLRSHTWDDSSLSKHTDLLPHVNLNPEDSTAIIHYTYWSEWQGLVATKLPVSMDNGVLKWGKREEEVLIPYNCGIVF